MRWYKEVFSHHFFLQLENELCKILACRTCLWDYTPRRLATYLLMERAKCGPTRLGCVGSCCLQSLIKYNAICPGGICSVIVDVPEDSPVRSLMCSIVVYYTYNLRHPSLMCYCNSIRGPCVHVLYCG
jgi:hypothetical protein